MNRQNVAAAIWSDFVAIRYGQTGDPRALEYLYPYLNHAEKPTRLLAIDVSAKVFEGRGSQAIDALEYFVKNTNPFLRDRAVEVVGSTVYGLSEKDMLEALNPYLSYPNQFIRKQALNKLGEAAYKHAKRFNTDRLLDTILVRVIHQKPSSGS